MKSARCLCLVTFNLMHIFTMPKTINPPVPPHSTKIPHPNHTPPFRIQNASVCATHPGHPPSILTQLVPLTPVLSNKNHLLCLSLSYLCAFLPHIGSILPRARASIRCDTRYRLHNARIREIGIEARAQGSLATPVCRGNSI